MRHEQAAEYLLPTDDSGKKLSAQHDGEAIKSLRSQVTITQRDVIFYIEKVTS